MSDATPHLVELRAASLCEDEETVRLVFQTSRGGQVAISFLLDDIAARGEIIEPDVTVH